VDNNFDDTLAKACSHLCNRWEAAREKDSSELQQLFSPEDVAGFSSTQNVVFLELMAERKPLSHEHLDRMDQLYQWTTVPNAEIRLKWHLLCLKANYEKIYPEVTAFASSMGRMKMARPLLR